MRILVTGGAGFIGANFTNLLLTEPTISQQIEEVTVLDKLTYAADLKRLEKVSTNPKYRFIQGSILDSNLIHLEVKKADLIFNFAAETHVDNSIESPNAFVETNVLGVQIIINALIGHPEKRLVHVSTDEVYGEILSGSTSENDILNPSSPYSASKAAGEMLITAAARTYGINYIITRGSNTYGYGQFPEKIIPKFIRFAVDGKKVPVYGDGKQCREWLHVSDHARGVWLAGNFKKSNEVFNIGSGVEMTNLDLIGVINSFRTDFQLEPEFVTDRPGHDRRYSLNSTKAKKLLNFSPLISITEGLKQTLQEELSKL